MKWKEEDPDVGKGLSTNIYKEDIDPGNCTIISDCRLIIIATLEALFFLLAFGSERDCTSVRWLALQASLWVNKNGIPMIGFFINSYCDAISFSIHNEQSSKLPFLLS